MKKLMMMFLLCSAVQMLVGQNIQIYTSTMGTITISLSAIDSITFSTSASPGGLMANPYQLEVPVGYQGTSSISGGKTPYSILSAPNSIVATASLSGNVLTVTGVGAGNTSVTVKDNSSPYLSATVYIYVRGVFTTPGSISFTSSVGNFSANGTFDEVDTLPTNVQGAGGLLANSRQDLTVIGYYVNSSTNWDVVMIDMSSTTDTLGKFTYPFGSTTSKVGTFNYIKGWNPASTEDPFSSGFYALMTGSVIVSSFNFTQAQGTFSGTGYLVNNGTPDLTNPITVSGGTFNVPVIWEGPGTAASREIVRKIASHPRIPLRR